MIRPRVRSRYRLAALAAVLLALHLLGWGWAGYAFGSDSVLMNAAALAYMLGLRHAVDADHIVAIDNVSRKLMQRGQRPVAVGLFFALGHSTVVAALCFGLAAAGTLVETRFGALRAIGATVGTSLSALVLMALAALNLPTLISLWRSLRPGPRHAAPSLLESQVRPLRGLLAGRLVGLLGRVGRSWHMYPLGLLFGLGFDTASEIGLLGISASSATRGLDLTAMLILPILFAAGMALVDTVDGVLVLGAYGWALRHPSRKIYYNFVVTLISVAAALALGTVELVGLLVHGLDAAAVFPEPTLGGAPANLSTLGCALVAIFPICWLIAWLASRRRGQRGAAPPSPGQLS